jgi:hypothetical protein
LSASMQIVLSSVGLEGMMKIAYWVPPWKMPPQRIVWRILAITSAEIEKVRMPSMVVSPSSQHFLPALHVLHEPSQEKEE